MKILHLTPGYFPHIGGMESFVRPLAEGLHSLGNESRVICSHMNLEAPDEDVVGKSVVYRVPFLTALTKRDPVGILVSKQRTTRIIKDYDPDIIHLHLGGPMAYLLVATESASAATVIITVYDLFEDGKMTDTIKKALARANVVVAISDIREQECIENAPEISDKLQRIYVSLPQPMKRPDAQQASTPTILMTGRQVEEKGFDLALRAFNQARKHVPEARLILAGNGPMHQQLLEQREMMGLNDVVDLPGRVSADEINLLYQQAWLTVVPSRHSESFGLVALEAMQASRPVIASNVGGLPEVVKDGENGVLVPVDDVNALGKAMVKLLNDRPLAIRMGRAGQERASRLFSFEKCLHSYQKLYDEILFAQ